MSNNFEEVLLKTDAIDIGNGQYMAHCPSHDDKSRSLAIRHENGKILFHCFANCEYSEIKKDLNISNDNWVNSSLIKIDDFPEIRNDQIIENYFKNTRGITGYKPDRRSISLRYKENKYFAIIFRSFNLNEQIIAEQQILIDKYQQNIKNQDGKKKRNIKISRGPISKGYCLVGNRRSEVLHITEGPEDAVLLHSELDEGCYCTFSSSNMKKFDISHLKCDYFHIWADGDRAGLEAAMELKKRCEQNKIKAVIHLASNKKDWLEIYLEDKNAIKEEYNKRRYPDWNYPQKLKIQTEVPVPLHTIENVPIPILDFALQESSISQSPIDFFIVGTITTIAAMASRAFIISPNKDNPNWLISPNIYGAICARPGAKKSFALSLTTEKILKDVNEKYIKLETNEIKRYQNNLNDRKILKKELNRTKERTEQEKINNRLKEIEQTLSDQPIKYHRLSIQSATSAAIINRASKCNKTIYYINDELDGFFSQFKDKNKADNRQLFKTGWNGTSSYSKETKLDGTEYVKLLVTSLMGTIQPSVLFPEIEKIFNGIYDDGLVQRFQLLCFPDGDNIIEPGVKHDPRKLQDIQNLLNNIQDLELKLNSRKIIRMDKYAQGYLEKINKISFDGEYDQEQKDFINSFLSKYPKLFCSLALVFELIHCKEKIADISIISEESCKLAFNYCQLQKQHLYRILSRYLDKKSHAGVHLAKKIIDGKVKDGMSLRDIYRKEWKGLKNKRQVKDGCLFLQDLNWLKITSNTGGYGPSPEIIKFSPYFRHYLVKDFIEA